MTLLSTIVLGFFLGMRHATDPDHVVAVTTIVTRHRSMKYASLIGALWGAGHTVTIAVVGSAIILFGWVIPPRLGLSMEFTVALMLVLLGIANLAGFRPSIRSDPSTQGERHPEADSRSDHFHHSHDSISWLDKHMGGLGVYQLVRPVLIGVVHGLAGSAAVALMVMATIHDPKWALVYLLVFGVGTIGGMVLITAAIGWPSVYAGNAAPRVGSWLRLSSGVVSLVFGLLLAYQIGVADGLFSGHLRWTPH